MYKAKRNRLHPYADITPLCDIAIVILLFMAFRWGATFWKPMEIEEPTISITPQYSSPRSEFRSTVFIGRSGAVMYELFGEDIRIETLKQMGEIYHIRFDPPELEKFAKIGIVCVPITQMKKYLAAYRADQPFLNQSGIPVSSGNNELFDWILESRKVSVALHGQDLDLGIDADKTLLYPGIENIVNTLEKQKLFKFSLIASINPANDNSKNSDADMPKPKEDHRFLTL
jgi:biopolymer transport protein ExbD